jgi:predicted outer membrane lipoprotein
MARLVLGVVLACALLYIGWLQRELANARSRGDMYRDIAAAVDPRRSDPRPAPSDSTIHKG